MRDGLIESQFVNGVGKDWDLVLDGVSVYFGSFLGVCFGCDVFIYGVRFLMFCIGNKKVIWDGYYVFIWECSDVWMENNGGFFFFIYLCLIFCILRFQIKKIFEII